MKDRIVCEFEIGYEHGDEKDVISRRYEYAGEEGLKRFLYMVDHFDGKSFGEESVIHTQLSRIMVIREFENEEKEQAVTHVKDLLKETG